ncbi:MAG: hypothetical protein LC798_21525 [Chloroflexi bacterium]|nr:hypothetical protein [Chloroflexota bacterium]
MSYGDVLDREEAWYQEVHAGLPPLVADQGGPFSTVAASIRRLSQGSHQLFLAHVDTTDRNMSHEDVRHDHQVAAVVLWAAIGGGARAHQDQARLDDAVSAVLDRIKGPAGDRGHGGRWWAVSDARAAPPLPAQLLNWSDAIAAAGAAYVVQCSYTCTEWSTR